MLSESEIFFLHQEANIRSATQIIFLLLWNKKIRYRVQNKALFHLGQLKAGHAPAGHFTCT
jgi:hypothetical protein